MKYHYRFAKEKCKKSINISNSTVQWNNFSEDTSVTESHGFNIMFQIFPTTVDYREYLREFPIHFIFFVQAKMGDNYDIWQEAGQLASCCTSI